MGTRVEAGDPQRVLVSRGGEMMAWVWVGAVAGQVRGARDGVWGQELVWKVCGVRGCMLGEGEGAGGCASDRNGGWEVAQSQERVAPEARSARIRIGPEKEEGVEDEDGPRGRWP